MSLFQSNVRNAHSKSAIPSPRGGPELSKQSAYRDQSRPAMGSRLAQTKWSRSKTKPRIPELPSHFFNPRPRKKAQIAKCVNEIARHKIDNVCHHHRQERIRRNIERHTEK